MLSGESPSGISVVHQVVEVDSGHNNQDGSIPHLGMFEAPHQVKRCSGFGPIKPKYHTEVGDNDFEEEKLVDASGPTTRFLTTAWTSVFTKTGEMYYVFAR